MNFGSSLPLHRVVRTSRWKANMGMMHQVRSRRIVMKKLVRGRPWRPPLKSSKCELLHGSKALQIEGPRASSWCQAETFSPYLPGARTAARLCTRLDLKARA